MSNASPAPLPWPSFGTAIIEVPNLKHLSFGARALQEADAFFRLVVRSLSFVSVECIHKFTYIE